MHRISRHQCLGMYTVAFFISVVSELNWDLVAWRVSENQCATQKVNEHWIHRISIDIEDGVDQYEDYVDH